MASVTNLADRVCRFSGLQTTGSERAFVLEFLNDAYREAVEQSQCYWKRSSAISVAADATSVTLSSTITDLNKIDSVYLSNYQGYTYLKLKPMSMRNYLDNLHASSSVSGVPSHYAIQRTGDTLTMYLYPSPSSAASVYVDYYAKPLTLVESGPGATEESTPTAIPSMFHYRTIASGAIAYSLEMDQRKDAQPWWDKFYKGIADLTAHINEMPGDHLVEPHFATNNVMGTRDRSVDLGY